MHQRGRDVGFLDRRMDVLGATAADAIDEVGVVVAGASAVRAGFDLIGDPRFVGVVAVDGQVAVGAVEDVADGVSLGVLRPEGLLLAGGLFFFGGGGGSLARAGR